MSSGHLSKVVCRLIFAALDAAWPTAWLESLGTIFHVTLRDVHLVGLTGEFSFLSALRVYTHPLSETLRRTRNGIIRMSPTSNSSSSDFSSTFPLGGSAGGTHSWLRGPQSTHLLTTSVGWGCGVWMGVRPGSFIYSCDNRCQFIRFTIGKSYSSPLCLYRIQPAHYRTSFRLTVCQIIYFKSPILLIILIILNLILCVRSFIPFYISNIIWSPSLIFRWCMAYILYITVRPTRALLHQAARWVGKETVGLSNFQRDLPVLHNLFQLLACYTIVVSRC